MAEQDNASNGQAGAEQAGSKRVQIQRIYIKDFSFESPQSPQIFTVESFSPEFSMNLGNKTQKVEEGLWEVVLTVSVQARQDDKAIFLAELHQAGLFRLEGFSDEEMETVLGAFCPAQIYPYAREVITSTVTSGGFPAPQLQPVNFDQLFMRQQEEQAKAQETSGNA